MLVTACRPLPTLGRAEGATFDCPPGAARRMIGKGLVARAIQPPRRPADGVANPGAATGALSWFPDWRGRTAIVLASGPSAGAADLELARGRAEILAVNESWRLAPWAAALYACDGTWWMHRGGQADFAGLKITQDVVAAQRFGLRRVTVKTYCAELLMAEAGVIGGGSPKSTGNSGFQALNLALQFGAARIILVGFDLNTAGGLHWHGRHAARLNNPSDASLARWAAALDGQAAAIAALGVEVINASPSSSLGAFRKLSLEEALAL